MSDSPARRHISEFVSGHPGSSGRAIQRGVGLSWGETAYHLHQLVKEGSIHRHRGGRRDFYFSAGFPTADRPVLSAMQSQVERAILVALAQSNGLTFSELSEKVGVGKSLVAFHLRSLVPAGLVGLDPTVRARKYKVRKPEQVLSLYRAFGDSFEEPIAERFATLWGGLVRD